MLSLSNGNELRMFALSLFITLACYSTSLTNAADVEYSGDSDTVRKIAFGSCHKIKKNGGLNEADQKHGNTIWDVISSSGTFGSPPDMFLFTGDSIYPPDKGTANITTLQRSYDQMLYDEKYGYSTFISALKEDNNNNNNKGIFGTWDDHDYGGNDRGVEMPNKEARRRAFWDFLRKSNPKNKIYQDFIADVVTLDDGDGNKQNGKRSRNGVYHSISFGKAPTKTSVIFLDTRSFRDRHCIPSIAAVKQIPIAAVFSCITRWLTAKLDLFRYFPNTCDHKKQMLGEEQWNWLENELENSDSQVHIVVSSVQVLTSNPLWESWCHFPKEKERLLRLLNNVPGLILLSGDVHHAEILSTNYNNIPTTFHDRQKMLEVTSSGMTHTCESPFYGPVCKPLLEFYNSHRYHQDTFYTSLNFGTIRIDWGDKTNGNSKNENNTNILGNMEVLIHDRLGHPVLSTGNISITSSSGPHYFTSEEDFMENLVSCNNDGMTVLPYIMVTSLLLSVVIFAYCISMVYKDSSWMRMVQSRSNIKTKAMKIKAN